jgi:hypothetical protein
MAATVSARDVLRKGIISVPPVPYVTYGVVFSKLSRSARANREEWRRTCSSDFVLWLTT